MHVKTFEAISFKDAVKAVKREFGSEAVILSTNEKVIDGPPRTKIYEVTAAIPESGRNLTGATTAKGAADRAEFNESRMTGIEAKIAQLQDTMALRRQSQSLETGLYEIKGLLLETLRGKDGSTLHNLPEGLVNLDRSLRVMGVADTHIAQLVKHLRATPLPEDVVKASGSAIEDFYRNQAMRWMLKRIKIAPKWTLMPGSTTVQAFVGTSGAGKTSVVAKIAAHYHLREKAKVAVVSYDNQRLAAAEQLRVYCKIIGVPFFAINDAAELSQKLLQHRETELVVIDTAGRSLKSDADLKDLAALRSGNLSVDMHLVAATTEKEQQIDRAVRHFSPLAVQSLVFTKLDESWSFGEIFNLSSKWSVPLSYFSTGQAIPEDLERASRERVVERIFGL